MADTTFINSATLTDADWFNDLNRLHYTILSNPADAAAVRTAVAAAGAADANTFTGANTFRNTAGIRSEQAATQDAIALVGRAGGTGSYEVTITPTTLTADRTVTVQDKAGTMALLEGTTTNDSAAAGQVGEYIESVVTDVSSPATSTYGDLTSIALTAGDWDVTVFANISLNSATMSSSSGPRLGIGTATGNSSAGLVNGDTLTYTVNPVSSIPVGMTISNKRLSLAAGATYYAKILCAYSAGNPLWSGRISARRVR